MEESNSENINDTNDSPLKYLLSLEDRARFRLIKRYNKPLSYHDVKMINDILYNEKTRYVEAFKEYLIYEDYNEFLKRFYKSYEISIKLPKILIFYEKYSKIYANYTVIPESKYMYKNIKRKQKMIDQMQNNDINSEFEEDEESNEDISNTVFSSRVINSIYKRSLSSVNKSHNSKNTEQSINEFLEKIEEMENNIKNKYDKNSNLLNLESNQNKIKKMRNNILMNKNKTPSKSIKLNNNQDNKVIDIQINYTKRLPQKKNNFFQNKNTNLNHNANNKNNYNNLIFINSYTCKTKNNVNTFKNSNSIGNYIKSCNNTFNNKNFNNINNNTFNGNNYLRTNINFPKQKISSSTLKQNVINNSNNNITEQKSNMSLTNINNNLTNVNNIINNNQKYNLSLRETLFKLDKLILSTNSLNSPRVLHENSFPIASNKTNIFNNKNILKHPLLKKKEKSESQNLKKDVKTKVRGLSSHKIMNAKKIRSNILYHNYNSIGTNLTFLSNNGFLENNVLKNIYNKFSKKNINNKYNDINSTNNKKQEIHRNFYQHARVLSGNNSYNKNKQNKINISNNNLNNNNKNYKITVETNKQAIKIDTKKMSFPYSPRDSSSSSNFYFKSQIKSGKNSINKKKKTKLIKELNKKKVINNFNIVNNIHDNSTQINIFTGKDLYKSLRLQNKSLYNSTNISPSNVSPKSRIGFGIGKNKMKLNINKNILENNINKTYLKSKIKGKKNPIKYNLDFKKIINNKHFFESEKAIISERLITNNKKIFEKLGKYIFKNRKEKSNNNKRLNSLKKSINNNNKNLNIIKHKSNEHGRLINKIMDHRFTKNKTNNNTPIKTRYIHFASKNQIKEPSLHLYQTGHDSMLKVNSGNAGNNIKCNNKISNLNDLKNFGIEKGNKLLIHSERNKMTKIVFK